MSMTCMQLKKFKFISRLRRPETHVRHPQGHQRASASTGSAKIIQNAIITVYDVKSQKTVNTKPGKRINWFSEVIKEFNHYFQEKLAGRQKTTESKVALHS